MKIVAAKFNSVFTCNSMLISNSHIYSNPMKTACQSKCLYQNQSWEYFTKSSEKLPLKKKVKVIEVVTP